MAADIRGFFLDRQALWNFFSIFTSLTASRRAPQGALSVLHYVVLAYSSLEIPFSIYYRYLANKAQVRRSNRQYTRKYLRDVFRRSLENGLTLDHEGAEDDSLEVLARGKLARSTSRKTLARGQSLRKRKTSLFGGASANDGIAAGGLSTQETSNVASFTNSPDRAEKNEPSTSSDSSAGTQQKSSLVDNPLEEDDPRAHDFREFLRIWFHQAKYEEIGRLNLCEWLAWSLYGQLSRSFSFASRISPDRVSWNESGQPYEELVAERAIWEKNGRPTAYLAGAPDTDEEGLSIDGDKLGLTEHCVEMVEARAGRPSPPGRNPDVKTIRLTLDPVRVWSRPLVLYAFVWCAQKAIIANSMRHGFQEVKGDDLRYLVRVPEGWVPDRSGSESRRPLLFLHGLGMGLAQWVYNSESAWKLSSSNHAKIRNLTQPPFEVKIPEGPANPHPHPTQYQHVLLPEGLSISVG
ncbi:hypothetical protein P7C70_g6424, partial [Phenoliferia sp. Uapishka_3]